MKHLTLEQRYTIQVLSRLGKSQKDIASEINKIKSVVSRELNSNTLPSGHYVALHAHEAARKRKQTKHKAKRFTDQVRTYVTTWLRKHISPELITNKRKSN